MSREIMRAIICRSFDATISQTIIAGWVGMISSALNDDAYVACLSTATASTTSTRRRQSRSEDGETVTQHIKALSYTESDMR